MKTTEQNGYVIVDVRGELCPTPVIETKKAVEAYPNQEITTIVDNEVSRDNVVKFGKSKNFITDVRKQGRDFFIVLTPILEGVNEDMVAAVLGHSTSAKVNAVNAQASEAFNNTIVKGNRIILMTKDYLGEGSQELGRTLMKTYWGCMVEADIKPKAIYFINSGVKMVAEGSEYLDNLRQLAQAGVEIAACGICLDFFGLKDKVAIGSITNMYTITDAIVGQDLIKL